jgi:hypothetical protein
MLLTRLGVYQYVAMDSHCFLKGLPYSMSSAVRIKFAGINASIQSYFDSLCALPDRVVRKGGRQGKAKGPALGPKLGGVQKVQGSTPAPAQGVLRCEVFFLQALRTL